MSIGPSVAGVLTLAAGLAAWYGSPSARGSGLPPPPAQVDAGAASDEDSIPLGNLGTTCTCPSSENSNGSGFGRGVGGLGPPRDMPADIYPASPEVRGGLDREIIRRIVRRHIGELFACYEPALARRRHLAGKLTIEFTVVPPGQVGATTLRHSTVPDTVVASCFLAAIRNWQFPHPHGQEVISQGFTLVPPHRSDRSWTGRKRR
jgi:hypothetical protein